MKIRIFSFIIVIVVTCAMGVPSKAASMYRIIEIGSVFDNEQEQYHTIARAINNHGQVVGYSEGNDSYCPPGYHCSIDNLDFPT